MRIAFGQSTTPHTLKNLQAGTRADGAKPLNAAYERFDVQSEMIGNDGEDQVMVGRLNRLLRQYRISNATALDTWIVRGFS